MSEMPGPVGQPLDMQVEDRPTNEALYCRRTGGPFDFFRWTEEVGWQKSAGWIPNAEPLRTHRLVLGPLLVPIRVEPKHVGAVVEEHLTGVLYVRLADGCWSAGGTGSTKSWAEIAYPIILSVGISVTS
jgi:hypothetical protein